MADRRYVPSYSRPFLPIMSSNRRVNTENDLSVRFADNLPKHDSLHSSPTIAKSRLTASVSINDLSFPPSEDFRPRFPQAKRYTPTRIPTPVLEHVTPVRYVSTPVLPSQKTKKENVQPKSHRLLGPISPSRNQPAPLLPKSKTMGMIHTLKSSLSRSAISLSLTSSRESSASYSRPSSFSPSAEPTVYASVDTSPPLPVFTTNVRLIHTAQTQSYWCGRLQALSDKDNSSIFNTCLEDEKLYQQFVKTTPRSSPSSKAKQRVKSSVEEARLKLLLRDAKIEDLIHKEENRMARVFIHLQALCTTNEAKKSLWQFQLYYARIENNPQFLPSGGKMTNGFLGRMGRAVVGGITGSNAANLSRRNGNGLGRKRPSMASVGED